MASLVYFLVLIALGQCHRYDESRFQYNDVEQQFKDKVTIETYKKEFKEVHYRLNQITKGLEKVLDKVHGVQEVVGYPTSLEQALEITNVETKEDGQNYKVVYDTDKIVKSVDSDGETVLPQGSSILTVVHEGSQKYWNLMKKSDVIVYHHHGSPVMVYTYNKEGEVRQTLLGNKFEDVEAQFSVVIPKDTFFVVDVLDKEDESFSVLSYSFFPGFVQEYHLKYPVEEQEGSIYKPTYMVRKYFGFEDVEPVYVNENQYHRIPRSQRFSNQLVFDKVFKQYFGRDVQSNYGKMTPKSFQKYFKYQTQTEETPFDYYMKEYFGQESSKYEQIKKVEGLLKYLVKVDVLPVEILRELPIRSYQKVEQVLKHLVKKNILPVQILKQFYDTESYEHVKDFDTVLPEEIKEYLYKYDVTPQELKKYFEDIPSYVREYYLNTPEIVRKYFEDIKEQYPMYLENIPSFVRQHLEKTPMDVKKFFENTPEEVKNYYDVLPTYVRKYFKIVPKVVRKYFEDIPEEMKYDFVHSDKYYEDIPTSVRKYFENTPEEVKTFFDKTQEDSKYFYGKVPVYIRKYFENTPKDVKKYFESIPEEKFYNEVLPKYVRKYFQKVNKYESFPKYETFYPKYNKYSDISDYKYESFPKYDKYETYPKYDKYETFYPKYSKYETFYPKYNKYTTFPKYSKYSSTIPRFLKQYFGSQETY